jgi:hypothetical protein
MDPDQLARADRRQADVRIDPTFAYVGTTEMFQAAGFRRVAETRARSAGLPRVVMRPDLA